MGAESGDLCREITTSYDINAVTEEAARTRRAQLVRLLGSFSGVHSSEARPGRALVSDRSFLLQIMVMVEIQSANGEELLAFIKH